MRVAIDALPLQIARTGPKTFLDELCHILPQVAPQHEFLLLTPSWVPRPSRSAFGKCLFHLLFYFWKEVQLPWLAWRYQCDLIFCSDYVVPLFASCPTVPVLYDADIWKNRDYHHAAWRFLWNRLAVPAARKSPVILTISEASKRDIVTYVGVPAEKVETLYLAPKRGTRQQLSSEQATAILGQYGLTAVTPFILHVGVFTTRKNLVRLLEAFMLARPYIDAQYCLVLVGQPSPQKTSDDYQTIRQLIKQHNLGQHVVLTGYVPDAHLTAFYQQATIYAFPSWHEGFGLPILEAYANDLPIIAANESAIPEIAGNAALLFDPYQVSDIANSMICLINDPQLQATLIQRGRKRLACFSWEKSARKLATIFEQVVSQDQAVVSK